MIDEKYVSIPFERWENHYKVLDEKNRELEARLEMLSAQSSEQTAKLLREYYEKEGSLVVVTALPESHWYVGRSRYDTFSIGVDEAVKTLVANRVNRIPKWILKLFRVV